ncbi:TPA: hypothetical protein GRR64_19235 [Vibrio parahaemolyticus]|nr:hypothetical protein [Vibrio parahaemolyticus]HAS6479714.1 hypothetical protein [Vibrio parahaemolyticus]
MAIGINCWLRNSMKNLLNLSVSNEFYEACGEWEFTGEVFDYEEPREICELCEKDELRYHFKIKNDITENSLLVGSKCILKFSDIRITNDVGELETSYSERERRLRAALERHRIENFLVKLRKIYRMLRNDYDKVVMARVGMSIKLKEKLPPSDALWLVNAMENYNFSFEDAPVSICLATNEHKAQLSRMPKRHLNSIWCILSTQQQEKYKHLIC